MLWLVVLGVIRYIICDDDIFPVIATIGIIVFAIIGVSAMIMNPFVMGLNVQGQYRYDNIEILEERYQQQKDFIMIYTEKYPMEEKMLSDFNPAVLLKLPEIKSDVLIVAAIDKILQIQDDIYKEKMYLNTVNKNLRFHKRYKFYYPIIVNADEPYKEKEE